MSTMFLSLYKDFNMDNIRIKLVREHFKLSQAKFAIQLGISQQTYANYESGKALVPDSIKQKLFVLGINLNWLVTGQGNMLLSDTTPVSYTPVQKDDEYITATGKTYPVSIPDGGLSIPILASKVSAGPGEEWLPINFREHERLPIIERFIRPYKKDLVFSAEVRGDSMTGIQLFDGDMVVAVRGYTDGEGIFVLTIDDEVYVKRLQWNPASKRIVVKSENERYEPFEIEPERITILGKVIGWLHRHPY